jgi:putative addiction module component (TIGR02574 family)
MTSESRKIEKQAQDLPAKERARLALKLIESLDPGDDEDVEELWLDEAERRLADYEAGKTESRPADEVFAEIEKKLG